MEISTALRPLRWYKFLGTFPIKKNIENGKVVFSKISLHSYYLFIFVLLAFITIIFSYIFLTTEIKESIITSIKMFKLLVSYRCLIKTFVHREMLAKFYNDIGIIDEKLKEAFDIKINYRYMV